MSENHNPNARYFFEEFPNLDVRYARRHEELRLWVAVFSQTVAPVGFRPNDPGVVV